MSDRSDFIDLCILEIHQIFDAKYPELIGSPIANLITVSYGLSILDYEIRLVTLARMMGCKVIPELLRTEEARQLLR